MKSIGLVALAIAALAPTGAHAALLVAPADAEVPLPFAGDAVPAAPTGFSLDGLTHGVDRVLASVERPAVIIPPPPAGTHEVAVADPVPEPATWLMMILGFLGLSFAVRRRGHATGTRVRFAE